MNNIVVTLTLADLITIIGIFLALLLDAFVLGQMKERKKLTGSVRPTLESVTKRCD